MAAVQLLYNPFPWINEKDFSSSKETSSHYGSYFFLIGCIECADLFVYIEYTYVLFKDRRLRTSYKSMEYSAKKVDSLYVHSSFVFITTYIYLVLLRLLYLLCCTILRLRQGKKFADQYMVWKRYRSCKRLISWFKKVEFLLSKR